MIVNISATRNEMGAAAAAEGLDRIRTTLAERNEAAIILATGASQFEMLDTLVQAPDVDWSLVTVFHLDEYIGLPMSHPASFRKYLKERFVDRLRRPPRDFHYINAESDPDGECDRLNALIAEASIDVAFIGIGENGHLAFNDPLADFEIEAPFIIVDLDLACRKQQLGEGWFSTLEAVPRQAISMSIRQIMKSQTIICTVPDARKAEAVSNALEGPVTPVVPASILQNHSDCRIFLDTAAASALKR